MIARHFFLSVLWFMQGALLAQLPTITNQPANRAVWTGCNVSFSIGASSPGPLSYQWQFNGTNLSNSIITTVAGNGVPSYLGDGGPATNASLELLLALSLDSSGNLFLPDDTTYRQRLRKVDVSGIINSIAGGGTNGLGDGGPATNATLYDPGVVAVDAQGNVFIPDLGNNRIREIDTNGIIWTVVGTGTYGFSGDGGPATNANLASPVAVTLDSSGNLFIADERNRRVRMVDTNGIISTVAGNGTFGSDGDGGPATNASFYLPYRLALGASGTLFILDGNVRAVDTNGIITTVAGNSTNGFSGDGGPATNAMLNYPKGLAADAGGNFFIADSGNSRVRKVDSNGIITTVAGGGPYTDNPVDDIPATNAFLRGPGAVAVDAAGNIFLTDDNRVRKVTNTQGPILALNEVTVANAGNYQVVVTGPGGSVTSAVATLTVTAAPLVTAVAPDAVGNIALDFVSTPNSTNLVLCATNLAAPVLWQPLSTNLAGPDGHWRLVDTNTAANSARFYRSASD